MGNECCAQVGSDRLTQSGTFQSSSRQSIMASKQQIDKIDLQVSGRQSLQQSQKRRQELHEANAIGATFGRNQKKQPAIESTQQDQINGSLTGPHQDDGVQIQYSALQNQRNMRVSKHQARASIEYDQSRLKYFFRKEDVTSSQQQIQNEEIQKQFEVNDEQCADTTLQFDEVYMMDDYHYQQQHVEQPRMKATQSCRKQAQQKKNQPLDNDISSHGKNESNIAGLVNYKYDLEQKCSKKDSPNMHDVKRKLMQLQMAINDSETCLDLQDSVVTRIGDSVVIRHSMASSKLVGLKKNSTTNKQKQPQKKTTYQKCTKQPKISPQKNAQNSQVQTKVYAELAKKYPDLSQNDRFETSPKQSQHKLNYDIGNSDPLDSNDLVTPHPETILVIPEAASPIQFKDEVNLEQEETMYFENYYMKKQSSPHKSELLEYLELTKMESNQFDGRFSVPQEPLRSSKQDIAHLQDKPFKNSMQMKSVEPIFEKEQNEDDYEQVFKNSSPELSKQSMTPIDNGRDLQNMVDQGKVKLSDPFNPDDNQTVGLKQNMQIKVEQTNIKQSEYENQRLLNRGSTQTSDIINRIKEAQLIDRKYERKDEQQLRVEQQNSSTKPTLESPTIHYENRNDKKQRTVHDILINALMNPMQKEEDQAYNKDIDQSLGYKTDWATDNNQYRKMMNNVVIEHNLAWTTPKKTRTIDTNFRMTPNIDQQSPTLSQNINGEYMQYKGSTTGTRLNPAFLSKIKNVQQTGRKSFPNQQIQHQLGGYESQSSNMTEQARGSINKCPQIAIARQKNIKMKTNTNARTIDTYQSTKGRQFGLKKN